MGRPKTVIDPEQVRKLAEIGCTDLEIALIVGIHAANLKRRFADILAKGREHCKMRLRMAQMKAALGGNVVMLIFLGKNLLGQRDTPEPAASFDIPQLKVEITGLADALAVARSGKPDGNGKTCT